MGTIGWLRHRLESTLSVMLQAAKKYNTGHADILYYTKHRHKLSICHLDERRNLIGWQQIYPFKEMTKRNLLGCKV
jgi:hypothetical protein